MRPTWDDVAKYYNDKLTRYHILRAYNDGKGSIKHEAAFMGNIYPDRCHKASGFKFYNFALANFVVKKKWGWFKSLLEIKMPNVPPSVEGRKKVQKELREKFDDFVIGCPYCIDIDVKEEKGGLKVAVEYAKRCMDVLKTRGTLAEWFFSGSKGFHAVVPWLWVNENISSSPMEAFRRMYGWAEQVAKDANVPFEVGHGIDSAIFRNKRQLWRTEWSVHPKTLCVKAPVTREYLDSFNIKDFHPMEVLR